MKGATTYLIIAVAVVTVFLFLSFDSCRETTDTEIQDSLNTLNHEIGFHKGKVAILQAIIKEDSIQRAKLIQRNDSLISELSRKRVRVVRPVFDSVPASEAGAYLLNLAGEGEL